ncbi:MAG: hypothetical protein ACQEUZ_12505 [Pseudomonadota bacterium]
MRLALAALALLLPAAAAAGEADVVATEASRDGETWRFDVTVRHTDEGWDHYADAWQVLAPDGAVLGERKLMHPHVAEQPFTRALTGVTIPEALDRVEIRARDSVHGWGGETLEVELPR